MRDYYGGPSIGTYMFVVIFIAGFIWFQMAIGDITIQTTGQPTINSLTNQLTMCQEELEVKCEPCPEVKCVQPGIGNYIAGIIVGLFFGFFLFVFYGEDLKKYLLKRLGNDKKKGVSK